MPKPKAKTDPTPQFTDLASYRQWVSEQILTFRDIFARAAVGDFSHDIQVPDRENEFTELYVGVQIMLEVIREKIGELADLNVDLESKIKERTRALETREASMRQQSAELAELNEFMVGRELKMVDLKRENDELRRRLKLPLIEPLPAKKSSEGIEQLRQRNAELEELNQFLVERELELESLRQKVAGFEGTKKIIPTKKGGKE